MTTKDFTKKSLPLVLEKISTESKFFLTDNFNNNLLKF